MTSMLPAIYQCLLTQEGPAEHRVAGLRFTRRAGNVFAYRISTHLARYCAGWMERLGLHAVPCYLHGAHLPADVGGEMWLGCLDTAGLAAVNLSTAEEFTRRARARDFDVLMITIAQRELRKGLGQPCPLCRQSHPLLHHIILHELLHAVYPHRADDNRWTDERVEELLAGAIRRDGDRRRPDAALNHHPAAG
jgi:hypothetical protein